MVSDNDIMKIADDLMKRFPNLLKTCNEDSNTNVSLSDNFFIDIDE